jgi:hypothetical protein
MLVIENENLEIGVITLTYLQLLGMRERGEIRVEVKFEEVFALQILKVVQPKLLEVEALKSKLPCHNSCLYTISPSSKDKLSKSINFSKSKQQMCIVNAYGNLDFYQSNIITTHF